MTRKFSMGQLYLTAGINESNIDTQDLFGSIDRHLRGDWGDVDAEDQDANNHALEIGARVLSSYKSRDGVKFWIITEADRSATTVLLPGEY